MVVGPLDVIGFAIQTGSMQMTDGSNIKQYVDNIPYPFAASASDDKANAEYLMQGINIFCLKKGIQPPMDFVAFIGCERFLRDRSPDIQWTEYVRYLQEELSRISQIKTKSNSADLRQYLLEEARVSRDE